MRIKKIIFLIMTTLFILGCDKKEDNDYLVKTNFDMYINTYPFDVSQGYEVDNNQQ